MIRLEGTKIADEIINSLSETIKKSGKKLRLDIIQIGDNESSSRYISKKCEVGNSLGINVVVHTYDSNVTDEQIIKEVSVLNQNEEVNGILIQLPIPNRVNTQNILDSIAISKDVDCLNSANLGSAFTNQKFFPATVFAVEQIIKAYNVNIKNKDVVILGSSTEVGLPMVSLVLKYFGTPTICNINTKDIDEKISNADVIISATGKHGIVNAQSVKPNVVIIDVGFSILEGKIYGDVDSKGMDYIASALTPVPKGVGPVTIASLYQNLISLSVKNG